MCVLDPDGDILRRLKKSGEAKRLEILALLSHRPLYLSTGRRNDRDHRMRGRCTLRGVIAEELFACGCRDLLSVTSAGQIVAPNTPPYFVVIDRALRDEGTSYHYAAPSEFAEADPVVATVTESTDATKACTAFVGPSWTTDAPFRETTEAIEAARAKGILAVEMEAAALYTFARARDVSVLCLAHVTNTMGLANRDFEKGEPTEQRKRLRVLEIATKAMRSR